MNLRFKSAVVKRRGKTAKRMAENAIDFSLLGPAIRDRIKE